MSANKYHPHVVIIPEDSANRQIAVGFTIECTSKQLTVATEAGGWRKVLDLFLSDYVATMKKLESRFVIMIVDCDGDTGRIAYIRSQIPADIAGRTFVLGSLDEPEALKRAGLGSFESIGEAMAADCSSETMNYWSHQDLAHNIGELANLRAAVCGILWPE